LSEPIQSHQEQDSEAFAYQQAATALQQEEEQRRSMRRKIDGRAKAKKDDATGKVLMEGGELVKPLASYLQSASVDFSHIPDECIKRDDQGRKFKVRWVNKLDAWSEPSETDIGYHERFGFEVIKNKAGKPFERREFVAMQAPLEGFAALLAKNARPGSSVYDQAFEEFDDLVERTNRKAGYRAVEPFTSADHGPEPPSRVTINV
jgi:hypothetical protein